MSNLVRIGTLAVFVAHFVLTIAYSMPPNPFRSSIQPLLDATIGTYFEQNWSLFAPTPRSSDESLLARPLTVAETADIPTRGLPSDGWYDLSTPLKTGFSQNRLSAYERLMRPQEQAAVSYLADDPALAPWRRSCEKGDAVSCSIYEQRLGLARAGAAALLAKVGSAFYQDIARPGDGVTYVALRLREVQAIPWRERYTGRRISQDIELGVYPIDRRAEPPGLYRVAGAE